MDLPTLTPAVPAPTPAPRTAASTTSTDAPTADGENGGFAATLDRKLADGRPEEAPAAATPAAPTKNEADAAPEEAAPAAPADTLLALLATPYTPAPVVVAPRVAPADGNAILPRGGAEALRPATGSGADIAQSPGRIAPTAAGPQPAHEPAPFLPDPEPHVDPRAEGQRADTHGAPIHTPHDLSAPVALITPPQGHPGLAADFHIAAPPPAMAEREITARVGTTAWNDGLAQQVTLLVEDGEQIAQLRLDPPDLGPLEVHLSLDHGEQGVAHVQFVSAHAPVRDALEAALPQLRAALAGNGILLGQATVGDQSARGEPQDAPRRGAGRSGGNAANETVAPVGITARRHGLVDTFA